MTSRRLPSSWPRTGAVVLCFAALTAGPVMPAFSAPTESETESDRKPNALVHETSPYLLQHAYNPVHWMPWGEAAFEEARTRNVPIFLSVGYSTCYWCHVMERESFENDDIARQMNENFVCIKVDREERPDVDDIYMASVQLLTGRGGWPMSVWLTPPGARGDDDTGLEPFYGGTYFPAEPRGPGPSFPQMLEGISEVWQNNRDQVLVQAERVTKAVGETIADRAAPVEVGARHVEQGVSHLLRLYDQQDAGFGRAPKFPQPVFADFLLEVVPSLDDQAVRNSVLRAVRHTLDRMAMGGMYDQVGGGFHRYSTDTRWLVPHFEKMLYDNGQLASLYAKMNALNETLDQRDPYYDEIIRETLDYVLREMTDERGGFYSAQDAEVNHREGQNYLWTSDQIRAVLDEDDAAFIEKVYGVDKGTNFQDPHHPEDGPTNVLFLPERPEKLAESLGIDLEGFNRRVERINAMLYEARMKRDQPGLDDKVLSAWNGFMIAGLADGARALSEPKYLEAAQRAASFILEQMRDDTGLLRVSRDGSAKTPAFLIDYAALIHGLLAIDSAAGALSVPTGDARARARALADEALERFEDPDHLGLLYDTLPGQSDLIVRAISTYDGAVPSGQNVFLNDLITLHERTTESRYLEKAIEMLGAQSSAIAQNPISPVSATRALHRLLQIDPDLVSAAVGAAEDDQVVRVDDSPVKVFAGAERVTVSADAPIALDIQLRIDKGYHVTASDPGVEGLLPLRVELSGGTGLEIETAFPEPVRYRGAALPEEYKGKMKVYEGTVDLRVTLKRTSDQWSGRPLILVTYQACDDRSCFQPITVELDVAIDPG